MITHINASEMKELFLLLNHLYYRYLIEHHTQYPQLG